MFLPGCSGDSTLDDYGYLILIAKEEAYDFLFILKLYFVALQEYHFFFI